MKKLFKTSGIMFTLMLATCSHQELKSPCHGAQLASLSGNYVPCDKPQAVNQRVANLEDTRTKKG